MDQKLKVIKVWYFWSENSKKSSDSISKNKGNIHSQRAQENPTPPHKIKLKEINLGLSVSSQEALWELSESSQRALRGPSENPLKFFDLGNIDDKFFVEKGDQIFYVWEKKFRVEGVPKRM